jgi:S1-C subfamily serine protease
MIRVGWLVAFLASLAFVLSAASCGGGEGEPTPSPTPSGTATAAVTETAAATGTAGVPSIDDLSHAVVQIVALRETLDGYEQLWGGSGTIIDKTGLILTNYHVVEEEVQTESGEVLRWDELGVALTMETDAPPEPTYFAQVLAQDPLLDLAVIQPYADSEGNTIDPSTLDLPTIPIGDATALVVGAQLDILGYPAIGGETITLSTGRVSGFLSQDGVEERRAWVKTDATAAPGNSGGAALDENGMLVGVPTRANTDVGGSINRVRPVNLADDVIARARSGEFVARGQRTRPVATPQAGQVFLTGIVFARDVTPDGELVDIVDEFPAGITTLVFAFDYAGMQDGYEWVDEWYVDGVLNDRLSGPRPPWDLGENGSAWATLEFDDPLPTGEYQLQVFVEGDLVAEATTYVGRSAVGPSIGPITLAEDVSLDDEPIGPTSSFPAGTQALFAFFDYDSAATVGEYRWVWVWKDPFGVQDLAYESDRYPWEGGDSGNWWVAYQGDDSLPGGDYEFELYMDDDLMQTGSFTIEGPVGEPPWPLR